uniref:Uncharacterized protein n=1 Tax=Siphoviridae sp. ct5op20 TaxID=2826295 RepID=A0A8S5NQ21_9CAUD|nr:MAG TPA: hypothetical protein [Siphoviridae sp. ct5op20]
MPSGSISTSSTKSANPAFFVLVSFILNTFLTF